jgi:histidine ammonia-lyase
VLAIEMMVAAQGIDFSRVNRSTGKTMRPGKGVHAAYSIIRNVVPHLGHDRIIHDDIQIVLNLLREGKILHAVEKAVGKL